MLLAFSEGSASELAAERVAAHLGDCSPCRRTVAAYCKFGSSISLLAETEEDVLQALDGMRDATFQLRLAPGARLGRYVVRGLAGSGAMGRVFAAHDPELDRPVALKLLHPSVTREGLPPRDARGVRLMREARSLARLAHPNVVGVYDVGVQDGQLFIAMEFVEGSTLTSWLRSHKRSMIEILDVFRQAARGLEAAHRAGIVHRDVKPDNILIAVDGRVKVTDFGLARGPWHARRSADSSSEEEPEPLRHARSSIRLGSPSATRSGAVLGTPAYMSPEQKRGEEIDSRSDQFSYCVALYEALVGVRPGMSREGWSRQCSRTCWGERIPGGLFALLRRGLSESPTERFERMSDLLVQLEKLLAPKKSIFRWGTIGVAALGMTSVLYFKGREQLASAASKGPTALPAGEIRPPTPVVLPEASPPPKAIPEGSLPKVTATHTVPSSKAARFVRAAPSAAPSSRDDQRGAPAPAPSAKLPDPSSGRLPDPTSVDAFHDRYE